MEEKLLERNKNGDEKWTMQIGKERKQDKNGRGYANIEKWRKENGLNKHGGGRIFDREYRKPYRRPA